MIRREGNMFVSLSDEDPYWLGTTTCNAVTDSGRLVMGAGHARLVRERVRNIDAYFGPEVRAHGPKYGVLASFRHRILLFQTKYDFRDPSSLELVAFSCEMLAAFLRLYPHVVLDLPMPGVGLGGLPLQEVEDLLTSFDFPDRLRVWTL